MKKLTAIILSLVMLLVPLTAAASAAGAVLPLKETAADAKTVEPEAEEEGGLFSGIKASIDDIINSLREIVLKVREILIPLLDALGMSPADTRADFKVRTWEPESGIPAVYQPIVDEFNGVIALARSSTQPCVIKKSVNGSFRLKISSGGNSINGCTKRIMEKLFPEYTEAFVTTGEKIALADYIVPLCGSIDASQVKYGTRTINNDGTSEITLTLYAESYADKSSTAEIVKDGIYAAEDFGTTAFAVEQFGAYVENVTVSVIFDTLSGQLLGEEISVPSHYDFAGTLTLTDDQQTSGWVKYDATAKINLGFFWK